MNAPSPIARRAALQTLGCRLNQSETASLAAALQRHGFDIVTIAEAADVVIINSCSVTAEAEADCRKLVRSLMRRSPRPFIAITGCYAQVGTEALRQLSGVDLVVGSEDKLRLPDLLQDEDLHHKRTEARVVRNRPGKEVFEHEDPGLYLGQTRANLKIQDGCNVGCSFCIIPWTRGRARSRGYDDALREARALLELGHRELVMTGVNLGSYREGGRIFADLLRDLDALPGLHRLRISSIEPSTLTEEVLQIMAGSPRICRHLHIPVQSGSDAILRAMRRPYDRRTFEQLLGRARHLMPEIALGTDVMVGFVGEDEDAFDATVDLVTNTQLSYLHVFSYSPRPGTSAARLEGEVPPATIRARSRRLREIDLRLRHAYGRRCLGQRLEVLFEERKADGTWVGLTSNYLRVAVPAPPDAALSNQVRAVVLEGADGRRWRGRLAGGERLRGMPPPC